MTQPVEDIDTKQAATGLRRSVALIIPTYNAAQLWPALSEGIRVQSLVPDQVIVIDSSSTDGTAELARKEGFTVIEIPQRDFNHGGTRQMGAEIAVESSAGRGTTFRVVLPPAPRATLVPDPLPPARLTPSRPPVRRLPRRQLG